MTLTLTVAVALFTDVELDIPDTCPGCGADFTRGAPLVEHCWDAVTYAGVTIDPDGERTYPEAGRIGEASSPESYACAECGKTFEPELT